MSNKHDGIKRLPLLCLMVVLDCSFILGFNGTNQGQARGYGRITHKRGRTTGGHYFQDLFTAKPLDIHHLLGYQMNDLDIVFPKIPHNTL